MRAIDCSGMAESLVELRSFSFSRTPSSSTSVFWSPVMPKPRRSSCRSGEPELLRAYRPPRWVSTSGSVRAVSRAMSAAVMTVIPTGASSRRSGKRVAVTTTASSSCWAHAGRANNASATASRGGDGTHGNPPWRRPRRRKLVGKRFQGRSPDSQVLAPRLPAREELAQWHAGAPALAYRCGGSTGIAVRRAGRAPVSRFIRGAGNAPQTPCSEEIIG